MALGAGWGRILRQNLVESILLALLGGSAGLLAAMWTDRVLVGILTGGDPTLVLSTTPDLRILGFTLAISTITGLLFGLVPALGSARVDLMGALKQQATSLSGSGHAQVRRFLVVAQVFVSLLLLIGAGLFLRSLLNLRTLNPGFHTQNVVTLSVDPTLNGYSAEKRSRVLEGCARKTSHDSRG